MKHPVNIVKTIPCW